MLLGGTHILRVEDVDRMFHFYTEKIGLEPGARSEGWASVRAGTFELGLRPGDRAAEEPRRRPFSLVVHGSAFVQMLARLREQEVEIVEVERRPHIWAMVIRDPEGNEFTISASPAQTTGGPATVGGEG